MDLTGSAPQDLHSGTPIAMGGSSFLSLANIKLAMRNTKLIGLKNSGKVSNVEKVRFVFDARTAILKELRAMEGATS